MRHIVKRPVSLCFLSDAYSSNRIGEKDCCWQVVCSCLSNIKQWRLHSRQRVLQDLSSENFRGVKGHSSFKLVLNKIGPLQWMSGDFEIWERNSTSCLPYSAVDQVIIFYLIICLLPCKDSLSPLVVHVDLENSPNIHWGGGVSC